MCAEMESRRSNLAWLKRLEFQMADAILIESEDDSFWTAKRASVQGPSS